MSKRINGAFQLIKETFANFMASNPTIFSASIAYYAMFSLPSIIVLIIISAGTFFGEEAATGELYTQISGLVGAKSADAIQDIVANVEKSSSNENIWATIIGVVTLILSATSVLATLQIALNNIWGVKVEAKSKWWLKTLIDRLFSMAMVVSLGFLLAISLVLDAVVAALEKSIQQMLGDTSVYLIWTINTIISLGISTLVFAMIFKVLPDVKLRWRDVWVGAGFTTVLFVLGKFLIGLYLGNSQMTDTYGAAGAFVIILVWIYYTCIIVLFGAECTQVYARLFGRGVEPKRYAVRVETQIVDEEEKKFEKTKTGAQ